MAAQLKPDGGRGRLVSQSHFEQGRTRPCIDRHAVPRTDVTVLDQRLPLRLAKRSASSPRARPLAPTSSDPVDIYDAIARFAGQDRIGYVHFRNVVGRAPAYHEVFLDEGYVDMFRALRTYAEHGYDGVFIPDHTPQMTCAAPWHAGMAHALGYMNAAIRAVERS